MSEPSVSMSNNAMASVVAVMAGPSKERDAEEAAFKKVVDSCVRLRGGHKQKPKPTGKYMSRIKRLYSVTTLAASARYGGRRTVAVYDSFDRAVELVENNYGDIYEFSYQLCVVEAFICNRLYGTLDEAYWFKWYGDPNKKNSGYRAIKTPEEFIGVHGHGIG